MVRRLQIVTLLLLVASAALIAGTWRHMPQAGNAELDNHGKLGSFSFTGRDGKPITDQDLNGRLSVFACFFTCCTESCPQIAGAMSKLQADLADLGDVRLVSLTVDPENDTPDRLNTFAQNFGADPKRWLFLTGPRDQVEEFVTKRLKQAVEENKGPDRTAGNKMLHSNMLVLVDRTGEIRGYFRGTEAEGVESLEKAIRQLHNQR